MLKKLILGIISVIFLASLSGYFYIKSKSPQRQGEIHLEGLTRAVTVNFDEFGIPHLVASNDGDLYRALGYIHAQDRLFQMELLRRLASGQMAEIFGKKLVSADKLYRTLGLSEYADKWVEYMEQNANPKVLQLLDQYLLGVNAFLKTGSKPIEFQILNIPSIEFTRRDVLAIMGFVSFSFAQGIEDDTLLQSLKNKFDGSYLKDLGVLYTQGFPQLPVNAKQQKTLTEISLEISNVIDQLQFSNLFHGSNSWLLSPHRTESGKAILVNDPHIGFGQPSVWYEAQLESDTTQVYGHFMGLIPYPLLGFNQQMAWGVTMFENDDMDIYAEKSNPQNPNQYWAIDHWEDYQISHHLIKVKGQADVEFSVKKTRHGPILNPILEKYSTTDPVTSTSSSTFEQPLALWWSFLDVENQQLEAFYDLPFADTVEKAAKAAEKIHSPGLNIMYANAKGDIAWWASAKLPIRPQHVNSKFILDGASGKDDILGFYDFSHNPQNVNPASGMLYTANNQPADMGDGLIAGYYAPKDRPARIIELLSEKNKYSVKDMQAILLDNTTPTAHLFQQISIPILKHGQSAFSELETQAFEQFKNWQGNHQGDSIGATIYTRFRLRLMSLAMEDEIGERLYKGFQHGFLMDRSIWRILPNINSPWWDNIDTEKVETRDELIGQAFSETVKFLSQRLGSDVKQWQWKQDVQMVHQHPLGAVKPLDKLFNVGPLTSNAGVEAINNLMFQSEANELKIIMGPSTRRIIDFGDIMNSLGINPTGQSGVVLDKHYADQAEAYSKGQFRRQYYSKSDVEAHSEGVLILLPD